MLSNIYSLSDLRKIEHEAEKLNLPLMQRAAQAACDWVKMNYPQPVSILVASGCGNNGGDALWCAYMLAQHGNYSVTIWLPSPPTSEATIEALAACKALNLPVYSDIKTLPHKPQLVIDGFFGIGLNRELDTNWQKCINQLNELCVPVLALDVPSGLDAYCGTVYGSAVRASVTLTFICAKPGLFTNYGADYSGKIIVDSLDIPACLFPAPLGSIAPVTTAMLTPLKRVHNSHKGSFGTVGVIGGTKGMLGAALLCGRAALLCGAGKVLLGTLASLSVDLTTPELMISSVQELLTKKPNVLAIGPGLSCSQEALDYFEQALTLCPVRVIDADALNLLAGHPELDHYFTDNKSSNILTPHPTEAARLLQTDTATIQADRVKATQQLANKYQSTVILKGAGSIIAQADGYYRINTTGSPSLSTAGQGDVLTGICAALLAQGLDGFTAASVASYIHGLAGESYSQTIGDIGLTASHTINLAVTHLNNLINDTPKPR